MEHGSLMWPPCARTTVLVAYLPAKKVHMSTLKKELRRLVALSYGISKRQSLQNAASEVPDFLWSISENF